MQWIPFVACLVVAVAHIRAEAAELAGNARVPRMIGGVNAAWGQFPSAVSINTTHNLHCGGVIVDEQHVLTAAQCVFNDNRRLLDSFWIEVRAGDITLAPVGARRQTRRVSDIFVHPQFNIFTLEHDVAVLRLDRPYELPSNTVNPANRTRRIVRNGASCQMAGWGATYMNYPVNVQQRALSMTVNDRDLCDQSTMHAGRIRESQLCAGNTYASTTAAPCDGNAGTGLYCDRTFVGTLSYGINCGFTNKPPVFTQVRFYNDWIDQQFKQKHGLPAGWTPGQL